MPNDNNYKPRIADKLLAENLMAFGAVCVEGPMWCGKTSTAIRQCKSACMIADPSDNFATRRQVSLDINFAFANASTPHLIDEWQEFPALWDATKYRVDRQRGCGQIILTGSSTPPEKGVLHSGAGRIANLRMRPMSLWESGMSEGKISLEAVCKGEDIGVVPNRRPELSEIVEYVVRGGWPGSLGLPLRAAARIPVAYTNRLLDRNLPELDGIPRDRHKIELLLRSLARNESAATSIASIRRDISAGDRVEIDERTLSAYLNAFNRLFVTENIRPFAPSLRSGIRIKQAEKRHFCDPSLAVALLKATPARLERDLLTLGFLFESLVLRDLLCYTESFDASLYHYQDYNDREIDAVVEMPDGEWTAVEVKLGVNQEESAAKHLLDIQRRIAEKGGHPPRSLAIIVGLSNAAYRRRDGVYVLPITTLKP